MSDTFSIHQYTWDFEDYTLVMLVSVSQAVKHDNKAFRVVAGDLNISLLFESIKTINENINLGFIFMVTESGVVYEDINQ